MLFFLGLGIASGAEGSGVDVATGTVRVAGVVLKWVPGDREANWERAERLIRQAAANGAEIVATAESFLDGYAVRDSSITAERFQALAEPIPQGPYFRRLQGLADELDIYLVAAISERTGEAVFNSAILLGPDGALVGKYRKKYLWPGEAHAYTAGGEIPTFETRFGRVGMMICFDRMQPEAVQELVDHGAEVVFNPSGGSWGAQSDAIMRQRSLEGGIPIVFTHPAKFLVTGPDGSILKSATNGNELDDPERKDAGAVFYFDLQLDP